MKPIIRPLLVLLVSATTALAQTSPIFVKDGNAIRGYDAVAYFTEGKPVLGDSAYSYAWQGANWRFASDRNRDAFKANPAQYAPQYGGYCAYGTADGHKAPTQPDAWTVQDGKLYLNYNTKVKSLWDKDRTGYIQKADKNWPALKDKAAH
ncbi:YHS domain-containing (seleno)protein [Fibrella arboris]|uniref:YHS domain-containing (seleno)protein n=1 Tax=Fibrella arboris TaxID=3242486 RepID=UPI0035229F1E